MRVYYKPQPNGRRERLRVLVLGYIVRFPLGGMTWHYLQYVLGLMDLGHEVYFLEDSDDFEICCYNPVTFVNSPDPTYGISYAKSLFDRVGVGNHWAYFDAHTDTWIGPSADCIKEIVSTADLLINVSGSNILRPWLISVPIRVLVDTDPAFEQVRQVSVPARRELALQHTHFFTFGHGVSENTALVPDDGLPWNFTRQPIVMSCWSVVAPPPEAKFTTVMQWDSYLSRSYGGQRYGMKSESFSEFDDLPGTVGNLLELAITGPNTPREKLQSSGWSVVDAQDVTLDPWIYQRYISGSKGEFSIAKHGYVVGRTGWFSERSACYLASGRPVLAQNTGFDKWLPTGAGLLSFKTFEEAVCGFYELQENYNRHSSAARELAIEYFDSKKVLNEMLDIIYNK